MAFARRQMIQALAGIPFAGPAMIGSAKANLVQALAAAPLGGFGEAINQANSLTPATPAMSFLHDARRDFEQWQALKSQTRLNGLDADLASMRSISPSYRALKQRERLQEDENLHNRWRKAMNW